MVRRSGGCRLPPVLPGAEADQSRDVGGVGRLRAGGFDHERHAGGGRVAEQDGEGLLADLARADVLVPVAARTARVLGVVGVHQPEPARPAQDPGQFVQGLSEDVLGRQADPAGYAQVREAVARSSAGDLATVFADALRERAQPKINQSVVDTVTGQ